MEKRIIQPELEVRQTEDGKRYIEGTGIVFGVESQDLGGFREIIAPDALKDADMSDVIIRAEHDNRYVLGRTKSGTAEVSFDGVKARYKAEIPNTTAGNDTYEYTKRGDYIGSSFAFSGVKDTWEERDNGEVVRTINKIGQIHDMGPVFSPAYLQTEGDVKVAKRSMEEWREKENKTEDSEKKQPVYGLSLKEKIEAERLRG